jgi:hypothetical protein
MRFVLLLTLITYRLTGAGVVVRAIEREPAPSRLVQAPQGSSDEALQRARGVDLRGTVQGVVPRHGSGVGRGLAVREPPV